MTEQTNQEQPKTPEDIYAIFCGEINANTTQKMVSGLTNLSSGGTCKTLHLLFQSWGGFVGDGVFLYNLLKDFPLDVVLYNAGHIASAGVTAFLGARRRKATKNSLFMIHQGSLSPNNVGAARLKALSSSLVMEDARTESILRAHLTLPDELWNQIAYHDVYFSGEDALANGLIDEIAEFSPPVGAKVLNALG